jgi:type I restriction enzyme M protein
MLDARNVYRKVTRKIYDFSPEQMHNLAAIVWLYRGQRDRFLALVKQYLGRVCAESAAIPAALDAFDTTLADLRRLLDGLTAAVASHDDLEDARQQPLSLAVRELSEAAELYDSDRGTLVGELGVFAKDWASVLPHSNEAQHSARKAFEPIGEAIRGLVKQVDVIYKLAARVADIGSDLATDDEVSVVYERRAGGSLLNSSIRRGRPRSSS